MEPTETTSENPHDDLIITPTSDKREVVFIDLRGMTLAEKLRMFAYAEEEMAKNKRVHIPREQQYEFLEEFMRKLGYEVKKKSPYYKPPTN